MCGRFAFFASPEAVAAQYGLNGAPPLEPRYNISPTQPVPVIRRDPNGAPRLDMLRWGLIPHWAKDPSIGSRMINARAETVSEKPAFRDAFIHRRCLVLASGFYEWGDTPSGRRPFFISRPDQETMGFAGLWDKWRSDAEHLVESCVIITTKASPLLARIHERMPVVLPPDEQRAWLAPETTPQRRLTALRSGGGTLDIRAVNRTVNDPGNEGVELIEPVGDD